MTVLSKQNHIAFDLEKLSVGTVGMLEGLTGVLSFHGDDAWPCSELVAISSVGFCHYVFSPELNAHEETSRSFSRYADLISNYGIFESIGYASGWDIYSINGTKDNDLWKLIQFEITENRPIITVVGEDLNPAIIVGYDWKDGKREVVFADGETMQIGGTKLQNEDEVFINWVVIVRPGERREWSPPIERHRSAVVRWAADHNDAQREFFQETRENYIPGFNGFDVLDALMTTERTKTKPDVELTTYFARHIHRVASARAYCATALRAWAKATETREVATGYVQLAVLYDNVATALRKDGDLLTNYRAAAAIEKEAATILSSLRKHLPATLG